MMRTMLRQTLNYLSQKKWEKLLVKKFNKIMLEHPLNINDDKVPDGKYIIIIIWSIDFI